MAQIKKYALTELSGQPTVSNVGNKFKDGKTISGTTKAGNKVFKHWIVLGGGVDPVTGITRQSVLLHVWSNKAEYKGADKEALVDAIQNSPEAFAVREETSEEYGTSYTLLAK